MVKPSFGRSSRRSSIVIPDRFSIGRPTKSVNPNLATRRILNNFFHLNYEPTQKETPKILMKDVETSTDDLPRDSTPPPPPPPPPSPETVQSADQVEAQPSAKDDDLSDKGKSRDYIRVKKSLLRKMMSQLKRQAEAIEVYQENIKFTLE